jgi:hypothetical protein
MHAHLEGLDTAQDLAVKHLVVVTKRIVVSVRMSGSRNDNSTHSFEQQHDKRLCMEKEKERKRLITLASASVTALVTHTKSSCSSTP